MKQKGRPTLLVAVDDGAVPTEFRLFKWGDNDTTKGVFKLMKEGAAEILRRFAAYGNDLAIDYEHQTFDATDNGPVPAAGWIPQGGIETRDDGLWATRVKWTDRALKLLAAKEYRYFSPTFLHNAAGEIVELAPVALVNFPATMGMDPLVAAKASDRRSESRAKLAAFADITSSLWRAISEVYGYDAFVLDVFDDDVVFTWQGRTWQCDYAMDGSKAVLTSAPMEVERSYVPVRQGNGTASGQSEAGEPPEAAMGLKDIAKALGLDENAGEHVVLSRVEQTQKVSVDVVKLTGAKDATEALATLHAWKSSHEELPRVRESHERDAILDTLRAEKKLTAAQYDEFKTQPLAFVKVFAKSAPTIESLSRKPVVEPAPGGDGNAARLTGPDGKAWEQLSDGDKHELASANPALFDALKSDHDRRTGGRRRRLGIALRD